MNMKQTHLITDIHAAAMHFTATQKLSRLGLTLFLSVLFAPNFTMGQNSLEITPTGSEPEGFVHVFSRKVEVFGVSIFATHDTPDKKLLHAANVLAQYLDNDADGIPDNKLVLKALKEHRGAVVMFATERAARRVDIHQHIPEVVWDRMVLVGLFGEETHPGGAADGVFDATYEEVLHLITSAGLCPCLSACFWGEAWNSDCQRDGQSQGRALQQGASGVSQKSMVYVLRSDMRLSMPDY